MYLDNLKSDFYEYLTGKRVVLIINYDIDGICTCKILQTLLKYKHVLYSVVVVQGLKDLQKAFQDHKEDVKHFVLINCGGTIDLIEELEPEDDVVFFVLDSHRPTDVCNIYNNGQIRLLSKPDEDGQVPEFHDIFQEESDDEGGEEEEEEGDEGDSGDEGRAAKRRRLGEEELMKRRQKRLWEEKRNELMFEYTQCTYYAKASALTMFDLAWKLNKDNKELLWLAIVGLTEQMIFGKIETPQYVLEVGNLQAHVTRLQNRSLDSDVTTSLKITFEKDLRLVLYRHWSVEASLKYSMYTACKLKLWSVRGDKKLQELLVDMGLPLVQSRQIFQSMDLQLRQEFHSSLEAQSEKYNLSDLIYATFTLKYGYRDKYCASDIVYALLAILESPTRTEKTLEDSFHVAMDCLSRTKKPVLLSAIEKAKCVAITLFKTVQCAFDLRQVIFAGPFVYYIVPESCLEWKMFSERHTLLLLAHFVLQAYVATTRRRKASTVPLIVSAPKNIEEGTCIIMGIPPLDELSPKNFFGKAFEQAAERINCDTSCDYFDTSYIQMHTKNRTRFLDALTVLLN